MASQTLISGRYISTPFHPGSVFLVENLVDPPVGQMNAAGLGARYERRLEGCQRFRGIGFQPVWNHG
jgi:hypothetical protein